MTKSTPKMLPMAALAAGMAMFLAVLAPSAYAMTMYTLTVSTTVNGHTVTNTYRVTDTDNDGTLDLTVSSVVLSEIKSAFGTTTFTFPGSYSGTFTVNGVSGTITLSSPDTYVIEIS